MNFPLLRHLLSLDERGVFGFLLAEARKLGYDTLTNGKDYVVCTPRTKPASIALVAHVDTVPRSGVDLVRNGMYLTNRHGVLGADDRAGVFALLEIASHSPIKPILIFTNGEELGGIGARVLAADGVLKRYQDTISLFIEIDREGENDYVYYSCDLPSPIARWAESYGFRKANGAYSDVAEFTKVTGIPHLNVSTGYYDRHTAKERLDLSVLGMIIYRVRMMIEDGRVPRNLRVNDATCLASTIPASGRLTPHSRIPHSVVVLPGGAAMHDR